MTPPWKLCQWGLTGVALGRPRLTCLSAGAARLAATRKPAGSKLGGGLGVKKLDVKVDAAMFEQEPSAEPVKPAEPGMSDLVGTEGGNSTTGPAASSRFAYDALTAAPPASSNGGSSAAMQRGKDGHLVLGRSNDDFFKVCCMQMSRTHGSAHLLWRHIAAKSRPAAHIRRLTLAPHRCCSGPSGQ